MGCTPHMDCDGLVPAMKRFRKIIEARPALAFTSSFDRMRGGHRNVLTSGGHPSAGPFLVRRVFFRARRLPGKPVSQLAFSEKGHAFLWIGTKVHRVFGRQIHAEFDIRREQEMDQVNFLNFDERLNDRRTPVGRNTTNLCRVQNGLSV